MYKKAVFALGGVLALSAPVFVSADSMSELQAKIQALLAQISVLKTQLNQFKTPSQQDRPAILPGIPGGGGEGASGTLGAGGRKCPAILRKLGIGAHGQDVRELQQFLSDEGAFSGKPTGFFGGVTMAAVKAWQAQNEVVSSGSPDTTGFGMIGPVSRAMIARRCSNAGSLSASPRSGASPLTVTFKTSRPLGASAEAQYVVDFGDGQHGVMTRESCADITPATVVTGEPHPRCSYSVSHTYAQDGAYKATLQPYVACMWGNPRCEVAAQLLGSLMIKVGAQADVGSGRFSASPMSGVSPLYVSFSYKPKPAESGQTVTIDFGDGSSATMRTSGLLSICVVGTGGPCNGYDTLGASHNYQSAGTYTASLSAGPTCEACGAPTQFLGSLTIKVTETISATSLSAAPASGIAPLAVSFTGTGLNVGSQYIIDYGDGANSGPLSAPPCLAPMGCNVTAKHTYAASGSYTAVLQSYAACMWSTPACMMAAIRLGSATVTVSAGSAGSGGSGRVLQQEYYCITSINPLVVQPLPVGSIFPSNCYNALAN